MQATSININHYHPLCPTTGAQGIIYFWPVRNDTYNV
jgi:hypothetical protein